MQDEQRLLMRDSRANETELGVKLQVENDTLKVSLTATAAAVVFTVAATAAPPAA